MSLNVNIVDLILGFSHALDLVKPQLAGHHLNVGYLADSIAEQLHLPMEQRRVLFVAATLHDAGAIPLHTDVHDLIFENNPELHSRAGWAILSSCPSLLREAELVLHHHTPWAELRAMPAHYVAEVRLANIINLADRVDVILRTMQTSLQEALPRIAQFCKQSRGKIYAQEYTEALLNGLSNLAATAPTLEEASLPLMLRQHYDAVTLCPEEVLHFSSLFSLIIDSISPFTATHSAGVACASTFLLRVAQGEKPSKDDLETIEVAGLLHDIGKLAIDPALLEKPSSLTAEEYVTMQRHAQLSYTLLDRIPGFERVRTWASLHHERLDGSGYPFGLTKDSLPLPARIVAVADVFTALTEDRPYRAGLPLAEALRIINELGKAGQLDPDLIHLLHTHATSINQTRTQEQNSTRCFFDDIHRACVNSNTMRPTPTTSVQKVPTVLNA